jgi:hypothetical protein
LVSSHRKLAASAHKFANAHWKNLKIGTHKIQMEKQHLKSVVQKAQKFSLATETVTSVLCVRRRTVESVFQLKNIRGMCSTFSTFHCFPGNTPKQLQEQLGLGLIWIL